MKAEQMLRTKFNATECNTMHANGVRVTAWQIGPRTIITLKDNGTGMQAVLLPPIVSTEQELITMIEDSLKGGYRVTAPLQLVEQKPFVGKKL